LIFFSFNTRTEILEEEEQEEEKHEKKALPLMVFNNIPCSGIQY
jgi:hypothetical protein